MLGNIHAMTWALVRRGRGDDITVDHLLEAHRRLLGRHAPAEYGGRIRDEQNWIGGSSYNPCSAAFVPPPPEQVRDLLEDLCAFCNGDDLPDVVQAALAHAQFETIHPFVDGNGRIGRALIHLVLRRRGLAPRVLPPISLILATWSEDYVAGLTATRYVGKPTSDAAIDRHERMDRAVRDRVPTRRSKTRRRSRTTSYALQATWRERLGRVRADSAADR